MFAPEAAQAGFPSDFKSLELITFGGLYTKYLKYNYSIADRHCDSTSIGLPIYIAVIIVFTCCDLCNTNFHYTALTIKQARKCLLQIYARAMQSTIAHKNELENM
ncbi:hypothetical protein T02_10191 [Trichinella nativa]|uniref:Uncharacterized protein n=1 Tax=Trichinella nativa TaxID=6335 RepID=A0A0V1KL45_9BILA|nr:hypothetical protein T02_10191 [Trichinella nativa]